MTRVLLLTGKGGVGKTTVAAATAVRAAAAGHRVLVTSTDPAHSLADALDRDVGDRPVEVAPNLEAQQLDPQARLEDRWGVVREFLVRVLRLGGLGEVQAEELVLLPGLDELLALIDLRERLVSGEHDLVVVDCAPTAETLRLLALPDALHWYLDRLLGPGRGFARAVAPVARAVGGTVPLPDDAVVDAVERLGDDLAAVHAVLRDASRTSMRLVTNPEKLALDETQRLSTSLALFGYAVDAVVVNRVLPDEVDDPYLARWKQRHATHLAAARQAFAPRPVLVGHLAEDEPIGLTALGALGEACYGALDPVAVLHEEEATTVVATDEGWVLRIALPFASRDDVDLARRGPDLHVRAGSARRTVPLPARLRRCRVTGAAMRDGVLEVRFVDAATVGAS